MGAAESVPRPQATATATASRRAVVHRSDRVEAPLSEKFDAFKLTEDRETDSMLVERTNASCKKPADPDLHVY